MRSMYKVAVFTLLAGLAIAGTGTAGQTNFAGGLHFNAGFPQGDFKDQIDKNAYGVGGQIFYAPSNSPLAIGLEFGWMNYGHEHRKEPLSTTVPDITVDLNTDNNIVQGFLILRGQMPRGPIRLYGDGLIGFNYLFTETKISGTGASDDTFASTTNQDDGVFAYGVGGGVMVPVYAKPSGKGRPLEVLLDAGLRYVVGGEAEYLKKGSITREDGVVTYDVIKSKTDMLRLHAGVMVRF